MLASCSRVNSLRKIAMNLQKADRLNGADRLTASTGFSVDRLTGPGRSQGRLFRARLRGRGEALALRDHRVLGVLRRLDAGVEDAEAGAGRARQERRPAERRRRAAAPAEQGAPGGARDRQDLARAHEPAALALPV